MGIYFNVYCTSLDNFKVPSEDKEITIRAQRIMDSEVQSVLFYASNGESEKQLLLEVEDTGMCCFIPYVNGVRWDLGKHYEQYNFAHYDYGFYHYAYDGKLSKCNYNDNRIVTIENEGRRLYISAHIPSQIRNGLVIEDFSFPQMAHQLLLCFAKLFGSYVFSNNECDVIERICPRIGKVDKGSTANPLANAMKLMGGE